MSREQISNLKGTVSVRAYVSCVVYQNGEKRICLERAVIDREIPVNHFWINADSFKNSSNITKLRKHHKSQQVVFKAKVDTYYKYNESGNRIKDYCFTEIAHLYLTGYYKKGRVRYEGYKSKR